MAAAATLVLAVPSPGAGEAQLWRAPTSDSAGYGPSRSDDLSGIRPKPY